MSQTCREGICRYQRSTPPDGQKKCVQNSKHMTIVGTVDSKMIHAVSFTYSSSSLFITRLASLQLGQRQFCYLFPICFEQHLPQLDLLLVAHTTCFFQHGSLTIEAVSVLSRSTQKMATECEVAKISLFIMNHCMVLADLHIIGCILYTVQYPTDASLCRIVPGNCTHKMAAVEKKADNLYTEGFFCFCFFFIMD